MRRLLWPALLAAGCAPSRPAMFDPVAQTVRERTGLVTAWREPSQDDPRAAALLAEPLTADAAAAIAVLRSPALQAAYEELGAAGALVARARTPPNPQLEAQFRFPADGGSTQIELSAIQSLTGLVLAFPRAGAAGA